jgi:hypothetical protein
LEENPVAKKKAAKVNATQEPKLAKPVRLDLNPEDHDRLERQARSRGLSMAGCARMVLLEWLKSQEAKG